MTKTTIDFINNVNDSHKVVQTDFGEFSQEYFGAVWRKEWFDEETNIKFPVGVNNYLKFKADSKKISDAREFGFIQQVKSERASGGGSPRPYFSKGYEKYADSNSAVIDQLPNLKNPLYSSNKKTKRGGKNDIAGYKTEGIRDARKRGKDTAHGAVQGRKFAGYGSFGQSYKDNGTIINKPATFQDTPHDPNAAIYDEFTNRFETAILAFSGKAAGMYLGSVKWGFTVKQNSTTHPVTGNSVPQGEITGENIVYESGGKPSSSFIKSAVAWNESTSVKGRENIIPIPTNAGKIKSDNTFLFLSESDVEGKHRLLTKDTTCMIFEKKQLGDAQTEYSRVRVEMNGKPMMGWIPSANLAITQ